MPLLAVDNLHVHFRTPFGNVYAIRGIDFEVGKGEILGVVGETGCGKSVTGRSITRLLPGNGQITQGRILFEGQDLLTLSETDMHSIRGKRIAMIFQDPATVLNPVFTIGQQVVNVIMAHQSGSRKAARENTIELLHSVGLPDPQHLVNVYPHQLSGGQQQRVMIAMCLAGEPDLIIADEPTTALDVTIQAQILDLLRQLQEERDISVILITHDLGVIAETCHKVVVLYAGRVAEYGPVEAIFSDPKHPYTQGLMAALPKPGSRGSELKIISGNVPSGREPLPGCAFAPRCEFVLEHCQHQPPDYFQFAMGHQVSCFLHEGESVDV